MRKTQVALAALALVASTAAMADVTAYGTIDASVVNTSAGTSFAGQGNSAGSIFGFKGSEDLGGGLKAGFNLESGLKADTGATGGNGGVSTSTFNRAANVSLGNESVNLTLGTQISPFIAATVGTGATAVGGNGAFVPALFKAFGGTLANVDVAGTKNGGFFIPEAANVSVNGGGLSASVMYRVGANSANSTYTAGSVSGSIAGINLAVAYQSVGEASGTVDKATNTAIAGNTEVAGVRLNAVYSNNKVATTSSNGYLIGASMPLVGALAGGVTYANNSGLGQGTQTSFSLQYNLSKATYSYLTYSSFSSSSNAVFANDVGTQTVSGKGLLAVGLAHSF